MGRIICILFHWEFWRGDNGFTTCTKCNRTWEQKNETYG
jgi:hypothetical protein